jgi:hypothetical protein
MHTFTHHNQPYGTVTFTVESVDPVQPNGEEYMRNRAKAGWVRLTGTVVTGSETSRIYQHTSTRDLAGTAYKLEVPPAAFEKGSYTTVAM